MDTNIEQLLDEIFQNDGFKGLQLYADKDAQSQLLVDEYLSKKYTPPSQQSTTIDWTAKCNNCPQFWYPAAAIEKCPDCGSESFDLYAGQIDDFSQFHGSGTFDTNSMKQSPLGKLTAFISKHIPTWKR